MATTIVPPGLLDRVVAYFHPQRVILFGSVARGEAGPDSDIDLLVIVNDDTPPDKLTWRAGHEATRTCPDPADVFPMRAETFEHDRIIVGTLAAEADTDGIVVYGPPKGVPSMKGADPRARWQAVERWLSVADLDRRAVELCLAADPPSREILAFHCQQAVEKLLKGFLVLAAKQFRKTHSLGQLGAAATASFPDIADLVAASENWSDWAVAYRYPSGQDLAEPNDQELRGALSVIDALAAPPASGAPAGVGSGTSKRSLTGAGRIAAIFASGSKRILLVRWIGPRLRNSAAERLIGIRDGL